MGRGIEKGQIRTVVIITTIITVLGSSTPSWSATFQCPQQNYHCYHTWSHFQRGTILKWTHGPNLIHYLLSPPDRRYPWQRAGLVRWPLTLGPPWQEISLTESRAGQITPHLRSPLAGDILDREQGWSQPGVNCLEVHVFLPLHAVQNLYIPWHFVWIYIFPCMLCAKSIYPLACCAKSIYIFHCMLCEIFTVYSLACDAKSIHSLVWCAKSLHSLAYCVNL